MKYRKFSDLHPKVQKAINSRKSPVSEYSQLDLAGLAEVFTNVNAGKPPCRCTANRNVDVQAQDCCKGATKLAASLAASLLQDC